jgi:solute carrier family 8 (sodium/calcium exchanger)
VTFDPTTDGGADKAVATVTIISDEAVRNKVDELAALMAFNADDAALSASTWKEQFFEAFEYEGTSALDMLMYLLALPWKVAFAFTPPPRITGGILCFFVTLAFIGLLTALIGDLAAHMGCCMGLKPSITAITFVALGTSLPDTFASRTAAKSEPYADASIGNITGSNSVNVFLGLGLPWMIAAIYWGYFATDARQQQWRERYSSASWYIPRHAHWIFVVEASRSGPPSDPPPSGCDTWQVHPRHADWICRRGRRSGLLGA